MVSQNTGAARRLPPVQESEMERVEKTQVSMNTLTPLVAALLRTGMRPCEIMAKLPEVKSPTISYIRSRIGLPPFRRGGGGYPRNKEMFERIRDLKASGLSYSQVGEIVGLSRVRTQQYLRPKTKNKPTSCQRCGFIGILHAHHTDYLTGSHEWICASCHGKATQEAARRNGRKHKGKAKG